jgi:oligopeptide/dipeptide ABC transporter ATP-binding protein
MAALLAAPLLEIERLQMHFDTLAGTVPAVDGVSLTLEAGRTLGIVGESGCGKSVTSLSILRLIASPPGRIVEGRVLFEGRDLIALTEEQMRAVRGNQISMIFQEPMTSLNPALTVGRQIAESLVLHRGLTFGDAMTKATQMLSKVRMAEPERRVHQYPHEISGGKRQRVKIAMALICGPRLLIADEPTTALDVTIQAQILELMRDLSRRLGVAMVMITHNLGIVARYADRVNVMYAGKIVERASARELYADARHPYTLGLLRSVPRLDQPKRAKLAPIQGQPPDLTHLAPGCAFAPRCRYCIERCGTQIPPLEPVYGAHLSACWVAHDLHERAVPALADS